MTEPLLSVKHLQYLHKSAFGSYNHKTPKGIQRFGVEDVSFEIEKGYIYGLVGRNGAGKTTLMNTLIRGHYGAGTVRLDGYDIAKNRLLCREHIGFITSPAMMFTNKSAYENGEILGSLYSEWNMDNYIQKLQEFDVDMDVNLDTLSRGSLMRVQAAFAFGHHAKLLIADEPTAGFDPLFRKDFLRFLQEYIEDGEHSVIFSTHLTEDLDKIADYLMIIHKRKIIYQDSMLALKEKQMRISELLIQLTTTNSEVNINE